MICKIAVMFFHSIYLRMTQGFSMSTKIYNNCINTVNLELIKLCDWLRSNKLSINVKKSNCVLFRPRQKPLPFTLVIKLPDNFNIFTNLEQINFIKYLGVFIDSDLSWKHHINYISQKVSRSVGIIAKLRHFIHANPF